MSRIVFVVACLGTAALAVIVFNAHPENALEGAALVLWGLASLSLGWGTGQPLWSLLVFVVGAFSAPFGSQDPPVYHEAATIVVLAGFYGIGSAALIAVSAVARMVADRHWGAAAE